MKSIWRNLVLLLITAPLAFVASCSSDNAGGLTGGGTDTTPPAISSITAIDMNHIEILFDEDLNKDSAERDENYTIIEQAPVPNRQGYNPTAPGDTLWLGSTVLGSDNRTIIITTWATMTNAPYNVFVRNVADLSGNRITNDISSSFTGVNTPDVTPPEIVFRSPAPNASSTGTGQSVVVQFSEPMDWNSVVSAFSWTHTGGSVPFSMDEEGDNRFVFTPLQMLIINTSYTATMSAAAQDFAANNLVTTSWSFTTTPTMDTTPPTLVSSNPNDGMVRVSANVVFRFTFSEPVDQNALEVMTAPDIGDGIVTWTNGGAAVSYDPFDPLVANTTYQMIIPPGSIQDLAGNVMTQTVTISFTTGTGFATGGFSGVLTGDPTSTTASDPTGTVVLAATDLPWNDDWAIAGTGVCTALGTYSVDRVADGTYFPIGMMDSNGDGLLEPEHGDAIGAFGLDFTSGNPTILPVNILGGFTVQNVDFDMYDPLAIVGRLIYTGSNYVGAEYQFYVSAWDTVGFDTTGGFPTPDYTTSGSTPSNVEYSISELDDGLADGTYYVGVFLDGNNNGFLDSGEPATIFGVGGGWTAMTLANGQDALDVNIVLDDSMTAPATSRGWGSASEVKGKRQDARSRLAHSIRLAVEAYQRGQ